MSHSLYFVTASWLAAQGAPVPVQAQPGGPMVIIQESGGAQTWNSARPERRGLWARIQSLFSRSRQQRRAEPQPVLEGQGQSISQPMPQGPVKFNEPPLAKPVPAQGTGAPPAQVTRVSHAPQPKGLSLPVEARYRGMIGHDGEYRGITGQLYRLEIGARMIWVVRYATEETEDAHGGSVALVTAADMQNFRDGDLVGLRGEILSGGTPSQQFGIPLYRASEVNLIERGSN